MKVTPAEYNSLTGKFQRLENDGMTPWVVIPSNEHIYEIDLNKRTIEAPTFLGTEYDADAEVIWFKVDRFYENFDLMDSTIWIQYKNANKESYAYQVPQIQLGRSEDNNNMDSDIILIPWVISGSVTEKVGQIEFSVKFFSIKATETGYQYLYNLNTQVAKTKVLASMKVDYGQEPPTDELSSWVENIDSRINQIEKDFNIYWIEVQ